MLCHTAVQPVPAQNYKTSLLAADLQNEIAKDA